MKTIKTLFFMLTIGLMAFACSKPASDEPNNNGSQEEKPNGQENPGENKQDQPVVFAPESWYETNYWERTEREKMGLRGPVKSWQGVNWLYNTIYEFDREGHLVSERLTSSELKKDQLTIYTYDEKGRLIRSEMCYRVEKGATELPALSLSNPNWDQAGREIYEYEYNNPGKYVIVDPGINGFCSYNFCYPGDPREIVSPIIKDLSAIRYHYLDWNYDTVSYSDTEYDFKGDRMLVTYHSYTRELVTEWDTSNPDYLYYDDNGNIIGGPWLGKHEGDILHGEGYEEGTYTDDKCIYKDNYPLTYLDNDKGVTLVTWAQNGMPLRIEGSDGVTEYYPGKRHINIKRWDCRPGEPRDALLAFSFWQEYTIDENEEFAGYRESLAQDDSRIREFKWYDYVYDEHGNWIQYTYDSEAIMSFGTDEKSTRTIKRSIEYY